MSMTLTFQATHLSIGAFPTITLPDFTIITGRNGSGKSHLLQALSAGNIKADCAPNQGPGNQNDVRLFDWNTMVPQDTGLFSSDAIRGERQNFYQQIVNVKNAHHFIEPIRAAARNIGLSQAYITDISRLASLNLDDIKSIIPDEPAALSAYESLKSAIFNAEATVYNHHDENTKQMFRAVSASAGKNLFSLSDKEVFTTTIPNWGQNNLFQQSFARLFVAYRDTYLENQLAKLQSQDGEEAAFLDNQAFLDKFGPAPWDFVNTSLGNAGLDFEINRPHLFGYTPYEPKLTKKSTGAQISFQNLSSGEKILMSFAFCVYYAQDRRQLSIYPKLLLLDEIDAPLHPSMSRGMIETIKNTLVASFGIKVISTTHSPSTVALADADAVFVMHGDGTGLRKTSKATALNILTEGVPTLAVNFGGRKQVLVESPADAQTYSDLYKVVKSRLNSECSLEFIATGTRSTSGEEQNTGCDVVKRLVSNLSEAGNTTVFGLLDWDQKNDPSERIYVVAHALRDGLENVLLDPLLIAGMICNDFRQYKSTIGISENTSYTDFLSLPKSDLQAIVANVCEVIFDAGASETVQSEYIGGMSLDIDKKFFLTDDHTLEAMILAKFPNFLSIARQKKPGLLMQHIINTILMDKKDFVPIEIVTLFTTILGTPAHMEYV